MDSEIAQDFSPLFRIYKDGRVERLFGTATVPASLDEKTGVHSKDVTISPETGLWVRLYIPKLSVSDATAHQRLPIVVYFHGGGFCIESAQSPTYHNYLNSLVSEANVVVVSVEYRRAPEHPLPAAFEDSWAAVKWVTSHSGGRGPEEWLNSYCDMSKVFLAGDSAGATIAHRMTMMIADEKLPEEINLRGMILFHPFFWGSEPVGSETTDAGARARTATLWKIASPGSEAGVDDPAINPGMEPNLSRLGCLKVFVVVGELDFLVSRGWYYSELLKKSGWGGEVEVMEVKGENHVFHLLNPTCDNAAALMKRVVAFLKDNSS